MAHLFKAFNTLVTRNMLSIPSIIQPSYIEQHFPKIAGLLYPKVACVNSIRTYAKDRSKKDKGKGKKPGMMLTMEAINKVTDIDSFNNKLQQALDNLKQTYVKNFALRTSPNAIENLIVKIDSEEYPLSELAQISNKKNSKLIVVNMAGFPDGLKPAIEALTESGMNLNPQQEGTLIYLQIPKVSMDHREKLHKNAKVELNRVKDNIRGIQNIFIKEIEYNKDGFSKDDAFNVSENLKYIATQYIEKAELIAKDKMDELLQKD